MTQVIFNSGILGFLIWLFLFATSTAALAVAIHCGWVLRKKRFTLLGREIIAAAGTNRHQNEELAAGMLEQYSRQVLRLIGLLSMCGNIAPMLGLLGTVTGMVDAFMGLGVALGPEKASILALSISHALYTTAAGLFIAIPAIALAVVFRNLLEKRLEYLSSELDQALLKGTATGTETTKITASRQ